MLEGQSGQNIEIKREKINKGHSLPGESRSWNKSEDRGKYRGHSLAEEGRG